MRLYDPEEASRGPAAALRWAAAGLLVTGLHLGAGWWAITHPFAAPPGQAEGIPIDLEPIAIPQNAPTPETSTAAGSVPVPQAAAAPEPGETADRPAAPPPEASPPAPELPQVAEVTPRHEAPDMPLPEPGPTPPYEPAPAPPIELPPRLPQPELNADAVLSPPPRPKPPPKPNPRELARQAAKRKALEDKTRHERAVRQEARAAARAQARAVEAREGGGAGVVSAAPSSASLGGDVASWRGAVLAHLNSFRPSSTASAGTARVSFGVDRSGRVVGASLAGSSGDAELDQMAVAMVRRASPVPAPPPELGGRVNVTVPVRFRGAAGGG